MARTRARRARGDAVEGADRGGGAGADRARRARKLLDAKTRRRARLRGDEHLPLFPEQGAPHGRARRPASSAACRAGRPGAPGASGSDAGRLRLSRDGAPLPALLPVHGAPPAEHPRRPRRGSTGCWRSFAMRASTPSRRRGSSASSATTWSARCSTRRPATPRAISAAEPVPDDESRQRLSRRRGGQPLLQAGRARGDVRARARHRCSTGIEAAAAQKARSAAPPAESRRRRPASRPSRSSRSSSR